MERFARLYVELDRTTRTAEKVAALERYFASAPAPDAAWALYFLTGRKLKRSVATPLMCAQVAEEAGLPLWMVAECYDAVGDLAETLALLMPENLPATPPPPLHRLVEEGLAPLCHLPDQAKRQRLGETWRQLDSIQRLLSNKLITGEFRVGVARTLVVRALAAVAGLPPAVMDHRLMGPWEPTEQDYRALLRGEAEVSGPGQPYPFFLASPLSGSPPSLGPMEQWQVEWKWDGIRAQLIRRRGQVLVWSRGEELITHQFPEIRRAGEALPEGTVLDGEILAWRDEAPLPFADLQRRLGRKTVQGELFDPVLVVFMAFDLLEAEGEDWRARPLAQRRRELETLGGKPHLRLSPRIEAGNWRELETRLGESRSRLVEGLMLKRLDSPYGVGRQRGPWWKWKIAPYTVDAVLIYAQRGHGRRAGLFTDYTFGVWERGELVPIAKAYSGLDDEEIREVDSFVQNNTLQRMGPVRVVTPVHVFELAFDRIQASSRHRSGMAVRFPRIARWRRDKGPEQADRLEALRELLARQ